MFPIDAAFFPRNLGKCSLRQDLLPAYGPLLGPRPFPNLFLILILDLGPVALFDLVLAFEFNPFSLLAGDF